MKALMVTLTLILVILMVMTAFLLTSQKEQEPPVVPVDIPEVIKPITYNKPSEKTSVSVSLPEPEPEIINKVIEVSPVEFKQTQIKGMAQIEIVNETKASELQSEPMKKKTDDASMDEIKEIVYETCKEYGVEPELVLAIIQVESNFQADIISKTGDYGLMQINKCNHEHFKTLLSVTDFLDPRQNIEVGVYILWDLITHYKCETEEQLLMAYNRGYFGAKRLWEQGVFQNTYTDKVLKAKASYVNTETEIW